MKHAAIVKSKAGIRCRRKDLSFDEAKQKFEAWIKAEKRASAVHGYAECLTQLAGAFSGKRSSKITS